MPSKGSRRKQTIPFAERLRQAATAARNEALRLPEGQERQELLKKPLQAETTVHINEVLSAPITQAADR